MVKASVPLISKRAMEELLDKGGREMYNKLKDLSSGRGVGVIWKGRDFRMDAGAPRAGQRTWNLQVNREAELRVAKALRDECGTHKRLLCISLTSPMRSATLNGSEMS